MAASTDEHGKPSGLALDLNIPRPDPSLLTTVALQREIFTLRELLETKLGGVDQATDHLKMILETRLNGMDQAIKLLQAIRDEMPARVDEKIQALHDVHDGRFDAFKGVNDEKFNSIQTQFRERDVRSEQSSKDGKVAVDAALQAAKEAVGEQNKSSSLAIAKSETATMKQIDGLGVQLQNMNKASDDKIADLKERLTRIEGTKSGSTMTWAAVATVVGLSISAAVFLGKDHAPLQAPQIVYIPAPTAPAAK